MSNKHDDINREVVKESSRQVREDLNADPITGQPGAHPVGTGVGAAGGAAAGAALGALAGPLGALIGGAIGAVVGGGAGKAAAEAMDPTVEDSYWRENYLADEHYVQGFDFDHDYRPAYAVGYANRHRYAEDAQFEQIEAELEKSWNEVKGDSRLSWDQARWPARRAWDRVTPRQ